MKKELKNKFRNMSENNKIVLKNVLGAFIVKGLALFISLFTMPAYLHFFNNETVLGMWFTILSVLSWILNFDLGIGNGLRNHLTRTITQKNTSETKKYLSSAYLSIGVFCIFMMLCFIVSFDFVNWNAVFNIESTIVSEKALLLAVKIVFCGIVLQLFFKLITSVLYALQKSSLNNFLSLCTSIIILISVMLLPSGNNDQNIICMAIIHVSAVIVPLLIATIVVFSGKNLRGCAPSIKYFSIRHAKEVLSLGGVFLLVQIAYMIIMSTNEYLITLFSSNQNVVLYQVYYRLFALGSTIFSLAMTPIWSAVTKAVAEKNYRWIDVLYKRLMGLAGIASIFEFCIIFFIKIMVKLWLGDNSMQVSFYEAIPFAFLGSLMIFNSVLSSITNGTGKLKVQAKCFGIGALLKIPLAWILVKLFHSWIGVVVANVLTMGLYCIVQPYWIRKYFIQMNKRKRG